MNVITFLLQLPNTFMAFLRLAAYATNQNAPTLIPEPGAVKSLYVRRKSASAVVDTHCALVFHPAQFYFAGSAVVFHCVHRTLCAATFPLNTVAFAGSAGVSPATLIFRQVSSFAGSEGILPATMFSSHRTHPRAPIFPHHPAWPETSTMRRRTDGPSRVPSLKP